MDHLTHFYLQLATDANMLAQFNQGDSPAEKMFTRQTMLKQAGVEMLEPIGDLTQAELQAILSKALEQNHSEWTGFSCASPNTSNTSNTSNTIGRITPRH